LNDDETLIQGNSIIKDNPKKRRINFETQLEAVDKFVKKHYKKHKLPQEDADKAREEIKRGLIKQSIFNKFVFNQKESHEKWGLIQGKDKSLRLAPLFSYDYCAGVEPLYKTFGITQSFEVKVSVSDFISLCLISASTIIPPFTLSLNFTFLIVVAGSNSKVFPSL
jgi:hypothetical protein